MNFSPATAYNRIQNGDDDDDNGLRTSNSGIRLDSDSQIGFQDNDDQNGSSVSISISSIPTNSASPSKANRGRKYHHSEKSLELDIESNGAPSPLSPLPSPSSFTEQLPQQTETCCTKCLCSERCLTHFSFFGTCFCFILCTSLPRFLTLCDLIFHIIIFVLLRPSSTNYSNYLEEQVETIWNLSDNAFSLFLFAIIRSSILFFTYAYHNHWRRTTFFIATTMMSASTFYVVLRISFNTNPSLVVMLSYSLIITQLEYIVYMMVRRQRILTPHPRRYLDALSALGIRSDIFRTGRNRDPNNLSAPLLQSMEATNESSQLNRETPIGNAYIPPKSRALSGSSITSSDPFSGLSQLVQIPDEESQIEPTALASSVSLFMNINHLRVHFILSHNGQQLRYKFPASNYPSLVAVPCRTKPFSSPSHHTNSPLSISSSLSDDRSMSPALPINNQLSPDLPESDVISSLAVTDTFMTSSPQLKFPFSLIFIHGFNDGVQSWNEIWNALSSLSKLVCAFDRPGFGLTTRPLPINGSYAYLYSNLNPNEEFSTVEVPLAEAKSSSSSPGSPLPSITDFFNPYSLAFAHHLLITMIIRNCKMFEDTPPTANVLIGHGSGAALTMYTALLQPHLVKGLILISPNIYSDGFPSLLQSLFKAKPRLAKGVATQMLRTEIGEVAYKRAWHNPQCISPNRMRSHLAQLNLKNWHEAMNEMALIVTNSSTSSSGSLSNEMQYVIENMYRLTMPVLILHGDDDQIVDINESVKAYHRMDAAGVKVKFVRLENCGHSVCEENPEIVLFHIDNFLKNL